MKDLRRPPQVKRGIISEWHSGNSLSLSCLVVLSATSIGLIRPLRHEEQGGELAVS
jgi:hypothetical protein